MNVLFDAIFTRWTAAMGGRTLYNTEGDDEASFPYSTVTIVGNTPDWTFTEDFEDILIQFNLFSETPAMTEVGTTFEALKVAFDFHALAITGYETVSLVRGNANLTRVDKKWQYIVTYRIQIQAD
ncbi:hypothetical protein LCGC14_0737150 [marine sediment metagenome]|uniref:Uncharacterized protein n=1 Tax=marine sediment metagenome TaxID=412755 RepID=A0A0F9QSQ6_9ZZZZ